MRPPKAGHVGASSLFDPLLRGGLTAVSPRGSGGKLSIVIFHRVLPAPDPIFPDDIDADRFDALCGWLAAWFHVLPLDEAVERLACGSLPARALSITFDDGYADNHDIAMPILKKHGLCATFFIATGFLDGGRMWNDTVVESVRGCQSEELSLASLGLAGVDRLDLSTLAGRRHAVHSLLAATKYLEPVRRLGMVDRIADMAGASLPDALMMRSEHVRALAAAGMQIGAHTVSHPILARLDEAQARAEMASSKDRLQGLLGRPVVLFAYPNGKPGSDYLPRDPVLAQQVGFRAAVTTAPGAARSGTDRPFELPRFTPWDRARWKFGLRLLANLRSAPAAIAA